MPKRTEKPAKTPAEPRSETADERGSKTRRARRDVLPPSYARLLAEIKERVRAAQVKAAVSVNRELIRLYWDIGKRIVERQKEEGWGEAVIEKLAADLHRAFPGMKGLSLSNLYYMRQFYLAYRDCDRKVQQLVGLIPWGHNLIIIGKVNDPHQRIWYAQKVLDNGWARSVLTLQIETGLYHRQGQAITNFRRTLPPPQSELAQQSLKDPYIFDFLTLADDAREREIEQGLIDHVQQFLLELGVGFALVGRQVHLAVGNGDFYIDLLFYHLRLRCYVVVELKAVPFKPEFTGKLNFYLSAVDNRLRHPDDRPSIGLLLCKSRDRLVVEYALQDIRKPIGVAEWQKRLVESLPGELQGSLPTIEELEAELARNVSGDAPRGPERNRRQKRRNAD